MANYLIYPFKVMKITQSYTGTVSHLPHTTGSPKDYPLDEGGKDTGRDPFYAPCKLKLKKTYGIGNSGTNTIWLESTETVALANGKTDYVTFMLIHSNDSDLKRLKVGQEFKKGEIVCYEGTDGATGNHIHMAIGLGKLSGGGWTKNTKGKWVLTTTNGAIKPEDAFYIDESFTTISSDKGLAFKKMPKEQPKTETNTGVKPNIKMTYTTGSYKVTGADVLKVRKGPGLTYAAKGYKELTLSARTKIAKLNKTKPDGYVKGLTFDCKEVNVNKTDKYSWGRTESGWVALDYCTKI